MANKSARRILAERIAAEKGIKIKSAMRYLQRSTATGEKQKIKNPKFSGLSDQTKKTARKIVERTKREAKRKSQPEKPEQKQVSREAPARQVPKFSRNQIVSIMATFDFYGNDKRHRKINLNLTPKEINRVLTAESFSDALHEITQTKDGVFLENADIYDAEYIKIGNDYFDADFWE